MACEHDHPHNDEPDSLEEQSSDEGLDLDDEVEFELESGPLQSYEAETERLRVYATLIRATLPRIGSTLRSEFGREAEIDTDVCAARNLALMGIFAEIRRIASAPGLSGSSPRRREATESSEDCVANNQ